MDTEIVYLGHDNTVRLQLKASSSAASLGSVTNITLTVGSTLISGSSSATTGEIIWSGSSFSTGEVRIRIGNFSSASTPLTAGTYLCPMVVYSATNSTGIVWGNVPLRVKAEVEA